MVAANQNVDAELLEVVFNFGNRKFSTDDFIESLKRSNPDLYAEVLEKYGPGGKGAGKHYSSNSWFSQQLNRLSNHGHLFKLAYEKAPKHYGSPIIRYWATTKDSQVFPDEVAQSEGFFEGAILSVTVNKYERNTEARNACIDHWGTKCAVCSFDFGKVFGDMGKGFIHVHHINLISSIGKEYSLDPIKDLVPVCPNCHAMLHRTNPPLLPSELKAIRVAAKKA